MCVTLIVGVVLVLLAVLLLLLLIMLLVVWVWVVELWSLFSTGNAVCDCCRRAYPFTASNLQLKLLVLVRLEGGGRTSKGWGGIVQV